ncbi:MAG: helix-turn-helix transcriptional regulator [Negativicutes bacterium]|nr:helix-turn-helix transcriptional regulator [Negativicutes bacterium]
MTINIGKIVRQKRQEKKMSAEEIGKKLSKPITKQSFTKRERNGRFNLDMIIEIANILGCDVSDFLPKKSTNSGLEKLKNRSQAV